MKINILVFFEIIRHIALMGRKSTYDREALKPEIIKWISDGLTLRDYCRQAGKPSYVQVYDWLRDDAEFSERFARARETGHDVIADEILEIVDQQPPPTAHGSTDAGFVSWQKNRAWARMQLLAKWNPKKYGESKQKVEVSGPDGGPIKTESVVVDPSTLDEDTLDVLMNVLETAVAKHESSDQPYEDEEEGDEDVMDNGDISSEDE